MAGKSSKNNLGLVLMLVLLMFGTIIKVSADECCQECVELCGCVGCPRTNYTCLLRCFKKCPYLCLSDENVIAGKSKDLKQVENYEGKIKKNQENLVF
ncbi:hypothetical protein AgCh_035405 [Apium graveolens]